MRLLHTSDWHLGRETYRVSRRPDHEAVVDEIVGLAQETRPHLILHSGDLFDVARPSYEDLSFGFDALQRLAAIAPTVVVCGNHDSPALFRLFTKIMGDQARLRFLDVARPPTQGGVLRVEGEDEERVRLTALPFIHANRLVAGFEDPAIRTVQYADRVAALERAYATTLEADFDPRRDINLFAAHLYVGGATYGRSERSLHVSEAYASREEAMPAVSYAALGHIHKPQALPGGTKARYAGSPIQLDFGEEGETKTVVTVEARPGRPAQVEARPLASGRRLLRLAGTLEEIATEAPAAAGHLVHVTVRSQDPVADVDDQVRALLPADAVLLETVEEVASRRLVVVTEAEAVAAAERSLPDLFEAFLSAQTVREGSAERILRSFAAILDGLEDESPAVLEGAQSLDDTTSAGVPA